MAFIPEIWAAKIYDTLKNELVALGITNQDYEGEVQNAGDTVHIFSPGTVTAKNYTKNTDIDVYEVPTDTDTELTIDQQAYFNVGVDHIDKVQSKVTLLDKYTMEGAYSLRDELDSWVLAKYSDAGITDTLTHPDVDSIYQFCNDMWTSFSNNNVPKFGRKATFTPRVIGVINEYLAAKGTPLGDQATVNGYRGKFAQWDIYESNNVTQTTTVSSNDTDQCLFTHVSAMTFAFQIPIGRVISYIPELRFANAVKALTVYGAKTLDANRLGAGAFVFP